MFLHQINDKIFWKCDDLFICFNNERNVNKTINVQMK